MKGACPAATVPGKTEVRPVALSARLGSIRISQGLQSAGEDTEHWRI
jgi:hypothetical protein